MTSTLKKLDRKPNKEGKFTLPALRFGRGYKAMVKRGTSWYVCVNHNSMDFWQNTKTGNHAKAEDIARQITALERSINIKSLPCGNDHCPLCPPPSLAKVHWRRIKKIKPQPRLAHRPLSIVYGGKPAKPHPGLIGQVQNEYGDWYGT